MKKTIFFAAFFLFGIAQTALCQNAKLFTNRNVADSIVNSRTINSVRMNSTADSIWVPDSAYTYHFDNGEPVLERKFYVLKWNNAGEYLKSLSLFYNTELGQWVNQSYDSVVYLHDTILKETYSYSWDNTIQKWYLTSSRAYNEEGYITLVINKLWGDEHQYTSGYKMEFFYSPEGKLQQIISYRLVLSDGSWINKSKTTFYQGEYGLDTLSLGQNWDTVSQQWITTSKTTGQFNPETNYYTTVSYIRQNDSAPWLPQNMEEKHMTETFDVDTLTLAKWQPDYDFWLYQVRYIYKDNGQDTTERIMQRYNFADTLWGNTSKIYTITNNKNQIIENGEFHWFDDEWQYYWRDLLHYENDLLQYILRQHIDYNTGELSDIERYQYQYDVHNNPVILDWEKYEDGNWEPFLRWQTFWSFFGFESVNEIVSDAFSVYPNPAKDYLQIDNTANKIQTVDLMDISGKSIKHILLHTGINTVNLSGYGKGTYLLRFDDGGVRKIIVR